ncbi:Asp23/Gls24 family envelope stress response protein [Streptomyces sp. NPDC058623]|uniref:Asp23/Gls24 family envelope stress response protein n=1 Tax=Streptomyces sp. NPDC058623 TaxID=3346563 RepID=UPI00365A550B
MTTSTHPPSSPPPGPDDERLPCGRLLSQAWAAWEDGATDPRHATCPSCARAAAELDQLETAVRGLRGARGPADYDATGLTDRVMDIVRTELRPGRPLPLGAPEEAMWITESAAARVLRTAAEQVPGVRSGSCRITPDTDGGHVAVSLQILAPMSASNLPALADEVRRRVRAAADGSIGLEVTAIDVRVIGFADASGGGPGGGTQ